MDRSLDVDQCRVENEVVAIQKIMQIASERKHIHNPSGEKISRLEPLVI